MLGSSSSVDLETKPLRQKFSLPPLSIHCGPKPNAPPSISGPQTSRDVFDNEISDNAADTDHEIENPNHQSGLKSTSFDESATPCSQERDLTALLKDEANITIDIAPLNELYKGFVAKHVAGRYDTSVIHPFAFASACCYSVHQERLQLLDLSEHQSLDSYIWNLATKLSGSYYAEIKHLSRGPYGVKLTPKEDVVSMAKLEPLFDDIRRSKTSAIELSIFVRWMDLMI